VNIIIISSEINILHIFIDEEHADYTLFNKEGHSLDGGVLDLEGNEKSDKVTNEIIESLKDNFTFSEPYIHPSKEDTQEIIERLEEEDYQNMVLRVKRVSEKESDYELEKE
jgi:hypothetical protein